MDSPSGLRTARCGNHAVRPTHQYRRNPPLILKQGSAYVYFCKGNSRQVFSMLRNALSSSFCLEARVITPAE